MIAPACLSNQPIPYRISSRYCRACASGKGLRRSRLRSDRLSTRGKAFGRRGAITILIFATDSDASPLIRIAAAPDEVRTALAVIAARGIRPRSCSAAAIAFLRALDDRVITQWEVMLESSPIFDMGAPEPNFFNNWIIWDPQTWAQLTLAKNFLPDLRSRTAVRTKYNA